MTPAAAATAASLFDAIHKTGSPFPGLRPFGYHESHLFFGRDGQVEKLIAKLAATRFLAVVGTSGSGKSSLVRAGLLPALHSGMMIEAGSNWRIAVLRPGNNPIGNLARALSAADADQIAIVEATLRLGSRGLLETVHQNLLPENENLLVVVDQFEELFRFAREARKAKNENFVNDTAAFVKLLLEAVKPNDAGIYVVLTMRSDFIGDCAQFWDLPEAVNESQYLIPRMTREQLREAIEGPVAVRGGRIAPRLVNELLNDIGNDQDQLPVLQHALMRTWEEWRKEGKTERQGDRENENPQSAIRNPQWIDLRHYEAIGGMAKSLSRHADEAYAELPDDRHRLVAERIFKALTEKGEDNREIRRPVVFGDLRAVAGAGDAEVKTVIETFRQPGRSFLMPPVGTGLTEDTLIDISHESLIRVWDRLQRWVNEEAESAAVYLWLAAAAKRHREHLRGPHLDEALGWRERNLPNADWALRYDEAFDPAMRFLDESRQARDREASEKEAQRQQKIRQTKRLNRIYLLAALGALALALYALSQQQLAKERETLNRQQVYLSGVNLAKVALGNGDYFRARALLNEGTISTQTSQDDLRSFYWYHLWRSTKPELAILRDHDLGVLSVAFSPDGTLLASASQDGVVKLWDWERGQERATLKSHTGPIWSVAFSPDGGRLATASEDRSVRLWEVTSGQELSIFSGHEGRVWSVAFSPDGRTLASASEDRTVRFWDLQSRRERTPLREAVWAIAFSPDGSKFVTANKDKTVGLWDWGQHGLRPRKPLQIEAIRVAFSPDGRTLAIAGRDNNIKLWDMEGHQQTGALKGHEGAIWWVAFSPDGTRLASASEDRTVKLWDVARYQEWITFRGHTDKVKSLSFSPDGKTLASAGDDKTIRMWDVSGRSELVSLASHKGTVRSVAFGPDNQSLASAGEDRTIRLWDLAGNQRQEPFKGHTDTVTSVAFAPNGRTLASASLDRSIKLWKLDPKQEWHTLNGHEDTVWAVTFSPDGATLASASQDKTIKLWKLPHGVEIAGLRGHAEAVRAIAFSPSGKLFASGSSDHTVKLWNTASWEELATFRGHTDAINHIAFSPDGARLASAGVDHTVKLWDVAGKKHVATFIGHRAAVNAVTFSPDGKSLVSASDDNLIKLWDLASQLELGTLNHHKGSVLSVAFARDGKTFASASRDSTVLLYFAATPEEVARQPNR